MIKQLLQYRPSVTAVVFGLAFASGWLVQGWRQGEQLAEQAWAHETQLRLTAEANAEVILRQQAQRHDLDRRLAALDTRSTQELSDALSENDRLRDLYGAADDERRRLRIEVRVARADATVSAATNAGSLGDATSVELSPAAGSAVWDIRAGMINDRAKLEYLQEWARALQPR